MRISSRWLEAIVQLPKIIHRADLVDCRRKGGYGVVPLLPLNLKSRGVRVSIAHQAELAAKHFAERFRKAPWPTGAYHILKPRQICIQHAGQAVQIAESCG